MFAPPIIQPDSPDDGNINRPVEIAIHDEAPTLRISDGAMEIHLTGTLRTRFRAEYDAMGMPERAGAFLRGFLLATFFSATTKEGGNG